MYRDIAFVKLLFLLLLPLALTLPLAHNSPLDSTEGRTMPTPMATQRLASSTIGSTEVTTSEVSTQRLQTSGTSESPDFRSIIRHLLTVTLKITAAPSSGSCLLSYDQVQGIQSGRTNLYYMVVNKQVLAHESVLELYVQLHRIVTESAASQNTVTDIWLSRVPCKICQEILEYIFRGASSKPTIHIESWETTNHNQTATYRGLLQSMGCISKLKLHQYKVVVWDWDRFGEATSSSSCDFYTEISNSDAEYSTDKDILELI